MTFISQTWLLIVQSIYFLNRHTHLYRSCCGKMALRSFQQLEKFVFALAKAAHYCSGKQVFRLPIFVVNLSFTMLIYITLTPQQRVVTSKHESIQQIFLCSIHLISYVVLTITLTDCNKDVFHCSIFRWEWNIYTVSADISSVTLCIRLILDIQGCYHCISAVFRLFL